MKSTRRSAAGFTLIEILVVLFIISIVTSVALLSISRNENSHVKAFASELTQMVTLAEEQAMLEPKVLGLTLGERSFHFAALQPAAGEKANVWQPIQDHLLGQHKIPNDIEIDVQVGTATHLASDDKAKSNPQIIISTNGDVTPFTIYVGKKGQKPSYVITGDVDGNVTNKALS